MPLVLIPFALLVVPILEIAAFILVGNWIGLWPTLGIVVASAVLGAALLKRQGLATLGRIQAEIAAGRMPGRELVDGAMILSAGILLLTPGLVTDAVGYLLFVPGVRRALRGFLGRRMIAATLARRAPRAGRAPEARHRPPAPDVVDLGQDDYARRPDPSSPWSASHEGNRTLH